MISSIMVAKTMKAKGFGVWYTVNPVTEKFVEYLNFFLHYTDDFLMVYYAGGSAGAPRQDPFDQSFDLDHALLFKDGWMRSTTLRRVLCCSGKRPTLKLFLASECNSSESIWGISEEVNDGLVVPEGVLSLAACQGSEMALTEWMSKGKVPRNQRHWDWFCDKTKNDESRITIPTAEEAFGIFTCCLCKAINNNRYMTADELRLEINLDINLAGFSQCCCLEANPPSLTQEALFSIYEPKPEAEA
jgi:hypothetical protein